MEHGPLSITRTVTAETSSGNEPIG